MPPTLKHSLMGSSVVDDVHCEQGDRCKDYDDSYREWIPWMLRTQFLSSIVCGMNVMTVTGIGHLGCSPLMLVTMLETSARYRYDGNVFQ